MNPLGDNKSNNKSNNKPILIPKEISNEEVPEQRSSGGRLLLSALVALLTLVGFSASPVAARNPDNVVGNSVQELVDLHPTDNSFVGRRAGVSWNSTQHSDGLTGATLWIGRARGPQPLDAAGPGDNFQAHFHTGYCGVDEEGQELTEGHYKHDPDIAAALDSNEIWFDITINHRDVGFAKDRKNFFLREGEFNSLVIHNPRLGGAKVACLPIP